MKQTILTFAIRRQAMIEFSAIQQTVIEQMQYYSKKMKPGRPYRIMLKEIRPKRTTGEFSQNHHLNGHVQQICEETGNDFTAIKQYIKQRAIKQNYPYTTLPNGDVLPKSEADVDVLECGYAIDEAHILAGELAINLREE